MELQLIFPIGVVLFVAIKYFLGKADENEKLLFGVYPQPGRWYWLKFCLFYSLLKLRSWGLLKRSGSAGYGSKSKVSLLDMERSQPLSDHPFAIDAAYFNGYNEEGYFLGAGVQRRPNQEVETLMFIRVPGLGILEWVNSPSTAQKERVAGMYSTSGGLTLAPVEAFKTWRVTLENANMQLREDRNRKFVVNFDLTWTADTPWIDFDTDLNPIALARSIACEPWSREFFTRLQDAHQTHHEQFGVLRGRLDIGGYKTVDDWSMVSMRDHSYGKYRDWSHFHRYILQYLAVDDGTRIALHIVSMPGVLMSHLVSGFVVDTSGRKTNVVSIDKRLDQIGEDGIPPDEYSFNAYTADGQTLSVRITKTVSMTYYCGKQWDAAISPYLCKAQVNGVAGRGMCEFEYFNAQGAQMRRTHNELTTM
uniref:Uncharacterized protein n=1 Tax=Plectus sambesii TaxID=2011161 RepID=A0A914V9C0_9BILA